MLFKDLGQPHIKCGCPFCYAHIGKRAMTLVQKRDLMEHRAWRQAYWVPGAGFKETGKIKKPPAPAILKQKWTALRGVFLQRDRLGPL